MELKIQSERVLQAAAKCKQAEQTLRTLFPEAFVPANPEGVFFVRSRKEMNPKTLMGFTNSGMLRVYEQHFGYDPNSLVVVVLVPSNELNGYSLLSWTDFHNRWEVINP